ncbi:uncharacterized protein HD556DRAFT_1299150, partial [Suillus plorans]
MRHSGPGLLKDGHAPAVNTSVEQEEQLYDTDISAWPTHGHIGSCSIPRDLLFPGPTATRLVSRMMHNTCPRSSSAPADDDLLTNESPIEASIEEGLARTMSSTLEQTTDNGIEPNENPAMSTEKNLAKISDTLAQILDVLKESTIAEERGKDDNSKFWATYKKVSTEHDDDFLDRANDDMGIILTFAGLFSAVNSTFIVGMQPDPGDTTNALVLQLIQIIANGPNSVPGISTLSSSTGFSSSTVWTQTLAYASLAFSVLAAFGAVLGKQWLN